MKNQYNWYSIIERFEGAIWIYDCIVEGTAYPTEKQCLEAIEKCKKEDIENGWANEYHYSEPRMIFIPTN